MADTADRDANHALRERLADVYGRYERLRSDLDDLRERLASLQVSAASADGLVRATVGPRGELIGLRLDPAVYRSHDPDDLARVVVATARSAAARTAEEVEALLAGYLPPESGTLHYVKDNDLGSLLRRADAIVRDA